MPPALDLHAYSEEDLVMSKWTSTRILLATTLLAGMVLATAPSAARAQKKSDAVVKLTAEADKPGADGKQTVMITLTMDKGWYVYANPVGLDDLLDAQTSVTITGKSKPESVKVDYPAGKVKEDKVVGNYKIYEEKTTLKAVVQRAKGDTGPLEVSVKLQACGSRGCLLPATIKATVP